MVSIRELENIVEARERQARGLRNVLDRLEKQKKEADPFTRQPIPKRRFGASVTIGKARQRQALETREKAKQFIAEKQAQQAQVAEQLQDVEESKKRVQDEINRRKEASRKAAKLFRIQQAERFESGETERDPVTGQEVFTELGAAKAAGAVGTAVGGGFIATEGDRFFASGRSTEAGREFFITKVQEGREVFTDKQAMKTIEPREKLTFKQFLKDPKGVTTEFITRQQEQAALTRGGRDVPIAGKIALGVASGIFGVASAVTQPIKTVKETGKFVAVEAPTRVLTGTGFPEVGQFLARDPAFATGRVAFEVGLLKGTQVGFIAAGKVLERGRVFTSIGRTAIVTAPSGERFIVGTPGFKAIGVIPGGKGLAKTGVPTKRGAFGFSTAEQAAFIGKTGDVATTARGLFGKVFKRSITVSEGEAGKGLFATPFQTITKTQEITKGLTLKKGETIPIVRESRIAPFQKPATAFEFIAEDIAFKAEKPQFVIFKAQEIGKDFKPFGFPSSELEVTLPPGKIIQRVKTPGVVLAKGRRVEIIVADVKQTGLIDTSKLVTKAPSTKKLDLDIKAPRIAESRLLPSPTRRISPQALVSQAITRTTRTSPSIPRISTTRATAQVSRLNLTPKRTGTGRTTGRLGRLDVSIPRITTTTTRITPPRITTTTTTGRPPLIRRQRDRKRVGKIAPTKPIKDDLFLVPDLTARATGITTKIPKAKAFGIAKKGFTGLEIRGIPKIV